MPGTSCRKSKGKSPTKERPSPAKTKNGNGIRFVQRKFAQGVPIPPTQHIIMAPPAPERRPEPPKEDQRTVYHSRMSARNLLDVIALQNVHRHKQPMVLLERLRKDEIPTPPTPSLVVPRKRAPKHKNISKNMCLRPRAKAAPKSGRKRKNVDPVKSPGPRKRARSHRDDRSSTTEDDMPLLFLRNKPKQKTVEKQIPNESNFSFKRPSNPSAVQLKTTRRRRNRDVTPVPLPTPSKTAKRNQLRRSARLPHPTAPLPVITRIVKRAPRAKPQPANKRPLLSGSPRGAPSPTKRQPSPVAGPSRDPVQTPGTSQRSVNKNPSRKTAHSPVAERSTRQRNTRAHTTDELGSLRPCNGGAETVDEPRPSRYRRLSAVFCDASKFGTVQDVVLAATDQSAGLPRRCRACRRCAVVDKIIKLTMLVNPFGLNPESVYDFNNDNDNGACPSLARLRDIRRLARTQSEEMLLFLDHLPKAPQMIKLACRNEADKEFISSARRLLHDIGACFVNWETTNPTKLPALMEQESLLDGLLEGLEMRGGGQEAREPEAIVPVDPTAADQEDTRDTREVPDELEVPEGQEVPDEQLYIEQEKEPELAGIIQNEDDDTDMESTTTSARATPETRVTGPGCILTAPVFRPTEEEFQDPIAYFNKIEPTAVKYGLCKIVPPDSFKPPCNISDHIRFAVIYQYISKLYNRWGPGSRELAAIKAYLRTQSVVFKRAPLLDCSEVNLSQLYHSVERNGGPTKVIQRKRWGKVAEDLKLSKLHNPERKLDQIYMRYLLPYATLSNQERQDKMSAVECCWTQKYQRMLHRARNPFHRQKRMLGESSSSEDESEDGDTAGALYEAEDCIVPGRVMNLATFKKVAASLMENRFESTKKPDVEVIEKAYWRSVLLGTEHIVANTASIDTGEEGYGFPKEESAEYGTHPWNLKMLARNPQNVLRFLGPVLGATVPTLHLSMLYSTSCWHRDPHGLPWTEFMHAGTEKIWYGIPSAQSNNFRRAVETLCPAYCQNKSIWLASDIAMIPPKILAAHDVKLSRAVQHPGEYVLVFPEAHSCSITTGYCVSESVYFATDNWLEVVYKLFQELRNSCEPTMFSLEQLLINGSRDEEAPRRTLLPICSVLGTLISAELEHRRVLELKGLEVREVAAAPPSTRAWNPRDQDECEFCRCTLYLSKVMGLLGRKAVFCPEHAIRLLETRKFKNMDVSKVDFITTYPTNVLEQMIDALEERVSQR